MKKIIAIIVIILIGVGVYFFMNRGEMPAAPEDTDTTEGTATTTGSVATSTPSNRPESVLGTSVDGNPITAYHFGTGDTEVLFVGGIHGGYSWNTALVGFEIVDYLKENPTAIPENVKVTVVPVLNPDGLEAVTGTTSRFTVADVSEVESVVTSGRFNGRNVDLNRNFDCDWQANGTWQNRTVSGGTAAFSEPESQAIRDYIQANDPAAVVVWYSAAGGVFASSCHNGVLPETTALTNTFAQASGYPAYEEFDFYEITGDMVNWLAKENVPAISVLLSSHNSLEWDKNQKGVQAILDHYAE